MGAGLEMQFQFLAATAAAAVLTTAVFSCVSAVRIRQLKVPEPIENGTVKYAILDCDYIYDDNEKEGLVVKWFVESNAEPVYQWIPQQPPQGLGPLRDRLDLDFKASEDNFTMYRAMRIIRPTTELSGQYKCKVSSFQHEDYQSASFIIYATGRASIHHTKPKDDLVNVTCHGHGLYPKPSAEMFITKGRKQSKAPVQGATLLTSLTIGGAYDVTLSRVFSDHNLSSETVFECVFSIPGNSLPARDQLTYYPGSYGFPRPTDHVTSLIMTTEPTLIGIPTVIDNAASLSTISEVIIIALLITVQLSCDILA